MTTAPGAASPPVAFAATLFENGVNNAGDLQSRIDRLAFQGEDAEDAFVDAAERLLADEAFKGFAAQGEFA